MKFGEKIKILRVLEGMTQSELATAAGLQQSVVARYEKGDVLPYSSPLARLAEALNQTNNVQWLLAKDKYSLQRVALYRPMSPFSTYSSATVRSIDGALATLFPLFVKELGLNNKKIFKTRYGSLFTATDEGRTVAIAVVCREEISAAIDAAFPEIEKSEAIYDMDLLNIMFFGDPEIVCKYAEMPRELNYKIYDEKTKEDKKVTISLKGQYLPDELINELESYINQLIERENLKIDVLIEGKAEEGEIIENLTDPKLWKIIAKKFKLNESRTCLISIDED